MAGLLPNHNGERNPPILAVSMHCASGEPGVYDIRHGVVRHFGAASEMSETNQLEKFLAFSFSIPAS